MMTFMFILMLLMAALMGWWLIPAAFVIWVVVSIVKDSKDKGADLADGQGVMLDDEPKNVDEPIDRFATFLKRGVRKVMN